MAGSEKSWRMFIPTRDSARYVSVFLDHYRALGIEPLYIVDGRSVDDTHAVLTAKQADVHIINPTGPFGVTELVQAACAISRSDWVLRMDDDEFPSREMLSFLSLKVATATGDNNEKIYFNREWIKLSNGEFVFFRSPRHMDGTFYDGQIRLFLNRDLVFEHNIHTAGVVTAGLEPRIAPPENFIVHFDAILKSTDEKLAKMRKYEVMEPGSAWRFADLYLPEVYSDPDIYVMHKENLDQFRPLIEALPKHDNSAPADITDEEFMAIRAICPPGLKPRP